MVARICLLTTVLSAICAVQPAGACSPVIIEKPAEIRAAARAAYRNADLIIDGVVISAADQSSSGRAATIRVDRVWKGDPKRRLISVTSETSCDISFSKSEQVTRLLLSGQGVFTADQLANGGAAADNALYRRELDLMIGRGNARSPAGPLQHRD